MSLETGRPLRVCYFGTYRANYMRSQITIEGLRQVGVEVVECHETLWQGIEDRVQAATGGWLKPAFLWRVFKAYIRLIIQYSRVGNYDVMVVGYPGQFDVFLARLLTRLRRKPLVWDILMSIYLVALDRHLDQTSPLTVNLLRQIEKWACRLPDLLILDTRAYVDWFHKTHGIAADRFRLVPLGADDRTFSPQPHSNTTADKFQVVYYGTFIPNHGVPFIIEAARLLQERGDICIELIGEGPDLEKSQTLAREYGLQNVTFTHWMEKDALVQHVASADVCLGAFGTVMQSYITVHNKIYEGLALAKPVITGDNQAVREALIHGEHLYLCGREDPRQLADAILELKRNEKLRNHLMDAGYLAYQNCYRPVHLGYLYKQYLTQLTLNGDARS